jgi:hypothetical protein
MVVSASRRPHAYLGVAARAVMQGASDDIVTDHGTQKPVEVMAPPIRKRRGDVYDPFLGSGTTPIAAEQVGRPACALELDSRYVQVAIERWQAYTGRRAERLYVGRAGPEDWRAATWLLEYRWPATYGRAAVNATASGYPRGRGGGSC